MKRIYMIIAAIAALAMTAQAQTWGSIEIGSAETATTYNGSYFDMAPTNFYVAHTGAQLLYTPDMLTELEGKQNVQIKGLSFMFHNETFEDIARNVKIYIQETDATEFAVNEDGVKQFFPLGEQVWEEERIFEMLNFYGEDFTVSFSFNCNFTPGKSLLVTIVFDALDDDNCTMGSDYAPFYSSGISGKAMTYTNNWNSFVDYAEGSDFPNATATQGCGTNVDLPYTKIEYCYEESEDITLLSQVNELEDDSEFTFNGDAVVTVFNNGYLFLRDESGYGMIAGVDTLATFANGQVLSEGWTATKTSENGWVRYTDATDLSASGVTNAELAAAQELTSAPDESMINAYVVYKNVTWSMFQRKITLADGTTSVSVFDMFGISYPGGFGPDNRHWNVYGIIGKNGNNVVLYPTTSFEEYVEPEGLRGDVNDDDNVNVADVAALINYLLTQDASIVNLYNADTTLDEQVNVADIAALINYLLTGTW